MPDITLAWMISRMIDADIISQFGFDTDYIKWLWQLNKQYYGDSQLDWGMGKSSTTRYSICNILTGSITLGRIDESLTTEFWLTHSRARTPGQYWETDPTTGKPTNIRCQNTKERMHASVRIRKGIPGRGLDDHGVYNPAALAGWTCTIVNEEKVQWLPLGHDTVPMPEDELLPLEMDLMRYISPDIEQKLWKIQGSS